MSIAKKTPYARLVMKHPGRALDAVSKFGDVYFINYKNSALGTGGVGTTTREMNEVIEHVKYVYYDKVLSSGQINRNEWNVGLVAEEAEALHGVYAKLHLWPLLHGIKSNIDSLDIKQHRALIPTAARKFAEAAYTFAQCADRQPIFWINDYVLAPVVSHLRELDPDALIVFSLRTPFGINHTPELESDDYDLIVKSMLSADLVTFHRKSDMRNFIEATQRYAESVQVKGAYDSVIYALNKAVHIRVVPMGSNFDYRQSLRNSPSSIETQKKYSHLTRGCTMVTSISRFEKSKGIDYELKVFEQILSKWPSLRSRVQFVRFSYMSEQKKDTAYYTQLRSELDNEVDRINKAYGTAEWTPIIARFDEKLTDEEVTGVLRAADILFIGSYADGFNHLAMEGIFSQDKASSISLVLGNIGAGDYIEGYYGFKCDSVESGANALYRALTAKRLAKHLRSYRMNLSRSFSIKRWIADILFSATQITGDRNGVK